MSTVDAPAPAKRCSKCAEVKLLTEFNRHPHTRDGRRSECRECQRDRRRARYREHADAGLCTKCGKPAAGRSLCAEHQEAHRAHRRARIEDGRDAAYQRDRRGRYIAQGLCRHGPGHGPALPGTTTCARCRAREQARYRKTLIEYTAILADQGVDHDGRCELCGLAEAAQVDHVLPRSLGGIDDDPLLLRWVCATCNASRGNNTAWVPPLTAWDVEEQLSREEDR